MNWRSQVNWGSELNRRVILWIMICALLLLVAATALGRSDQTPGKRDDHDSACLMAVDDDHDSGDGGPDTGGGDASAGASPSASPNPSRSPRPSQSPSVDTVCPSPDPNATPTPTPSPTPTPTPKRTPHEDASADGDSESGD